MALSKIGTPGLESSISTNLTGTVNGFTPTLSNMAGRNKIINGAFNIWQRGTSFTPSGVIYGADRFAAYKAGASAGDYARSTDVPSGEGFTYSGYFNNADIRYAVELLGAGLPGEFVDGSQWTLSFWVKAAASGSSAVNIGWANGASASSLTYWGSAKTYNYSASWQKVTLSFTVSGTPTGSHLAALIYFDAVGGLLITGVQLEAGSVATPFEHVDYGTSLMRCMRYYETYTATNNFFVAVSVGNYPRINGTWVVSKRANPTTIVPAGWSIAGRVNHYEGYNNTAADALFPSFSADAEL